MGADAYAYTLVGMCFKAKDIVTAKKVKAFGHSYGEDMNFCPKTGKTLWCVENVFPDGANCWNETFQGLDVVKECSEDPISGDTKLYVGIRHDSGTFVSTGTITSDYHKVRVVLEKFNLWNPSAAGVFTILHWSV